MTIEEARKHLATLWFIVSGLLFLLLILQTIAGKYADKVNEAWGWFLPTIMPSLSLIAATWVSDVTQTSAEIQEANIFLYRLALSVSGFYLLAVFLALIGNIFSNTPPLELMRQSNLFLGPIQGLVAAIIGLFFIRKSSPKGR